MRLVHYVNQFFAGVGGEDAAATPPGVGDGPIGPGRRLQALLGPAYEIVASVYCGDDLASGNADAQAEILALVADAEPELVVLGPAFGSGRYGLACARLAAAAADRGLPALAALHPDNPALSEAGGGHVVACGATSREMGPSLDRLAAAVRKLAAGEPLGEADGRIGSAPRRNVLADRPAADRAVTLLLARLGGDREGGEVPLPSFDRVTPAPPVDDLSTATVALLTEGALVPAGNPDRLESARATRWLRYDLDGRDAVSPGEFMSVHGGFSTVAANADPHRILPLDAARELERRGAVGRLHGAYFVTVGNGTPVGMAKRFGDEWATELRKAGVQAAILTAT